MTTDQTRLTDAQLLALMAAGDPNSLKTLILRYHRVFTAMAFANSLSSADGEEAVNDAFVKIWHSADKYQDLGLDAKYWLRTLMRHALLDKLRTIKRFALEESATKVSSDGEFLADRYGDDHALADRSPAPPDVLEALQENACFNACLAALSGSHRDTLQRCLIASQTEAEIAAETAQSIGTVKSRKHYAVKKMQLCVADCLRGAGTGEVHD
jgi:RNA polymerase sigma-70 factor (ECF subfamily)